MSEWWRPLWKGMPAFDSEDRMPKRTLAVRFRGEEDRGAFLAHAGIPKLYHETDGEALGGWTWWPPQGYQKMADQIWVGGPNPIYPVYVISKGRWESRLTARWLERMGVPFHIVIEPQEHDQYAAVIDPAKILVLPFSNLGLGSIPARNWVWEHALASGAARHWILDDNIEGFYRLHQNLKFRLMTGAGFRAIEAWADRYENVGIAGMQYEMFVKRKFKWAPLNLNTRVYSCILIRNDLPYRWRGRYNEDTDLSLCALKDGWVTALFYAFLAKKIATMRMKGGNTDELYAEDGRLKMAQALYKLHPDVTRITHKWGRWQHHVDYRPFEGNALRLLPGVEVPEGVDEFGMKLESR